MNPRLEQLHPYPFQKLRELFAGVIPNPDLAPINLSIGEPKHPTPQFIKDALVAGLNGLANYPITQGSDALRASIAAWAERRYGVKLDPATEVLPVNGSREALFAFARPASIPAATAAVSSSRPIRSTRSTKVRRCWPAPAPSSSTRCRKMASAWTGRGCRRICGNR